MYVSVSAQLLNCARLFVNPARLLCPWDFPGKNSWSELPFSSPGDFPDPGTEPVSPVLLALAGRFFPTVSPGKIIPCIANDGYKYIFFACEDAAS